jgi:hypothetical protein
VKSLSARSFPLFLILLSLALAGVCRAGSATGIFNLYYTGVDDSGAVLGNAAQDSHWKVSYARVGGTVYTGNSTYTGTSYVVSSNFIDGAWVQNSTTSRWITAPGAKTSATGTTNTGGDYLPGNGTTGTNSAYYVYQLAFYIGGTGTGTVTNQVSISLTIAADDQYSVYVNPASGPTVNNSGVINTGGTAASGSRTSAWNNTTSLTLQNFGPAANADFVIGTNYLYIVVANTNSQTNNSNSNSVNPSGLLVYQVGNALMIDGQVVPEVGTILPVVAALGMFGLRRFRRRDRSAKV